MRKYSSLFLYRRTYPNPILILYTITTQTIISQLPHKRKYRISIIDTRHFRIQTLVSLYRTENSSRLSRVFLIRCPWDSNPRTEVLQTCTIDHSVRAPYITLSSVYKNSKKNQVKDYCNYLSFKIFLTTYNIEQKEKVWLLPFDYLIMIE